MMEAYTLDRGAVAGSFDLASFSFFAYLTPPGSRQAGHGLVVYKRKMAGYETAPTAETGLTHSSSGPAAASPACGQPAVADPSMLREAAAPVKTEDVRAKDRSGCLGGLCRWRRWLCMGVDYGPELRDAAVTSWPVATFLFTAEAERDMWLQIIARWQRSLQQPSSPSPVRPVVPDLSSHVNSTVLGWSSAVLGWAAWPFACCIPNSRSRRALGDAGPRKTPQWENVVFSGGGIKGLVFPAALGAVADCYGPDGRSLGWIKGVAGVSAGSVIATLVACGCKIDEIKASAATLNLMHLSASMSTIQGVS
jgi:hypothetical protein